MIWICPKVPGYPNGYRNGEHEDHGMDLDGFGGSEVSTPHVIPG